MSVEFSGGKIPVHKYSRAQVPVSAKISLNKYRPTKNVIKIYIYTDKSPIRKKAI